MGSQRIRYSVHIGQQQRSQKKFAFAFVRCKWTWSGTQFTSSTVHPLGSYTMEGGEYLHQRSERDGGCGQGGTRRVLPDSRGAQLPPGAGRTVRGETRGTRPGRVSTWLPGRLTTPSGQAAPSGAKLGEPGHAGRVPDSRGAQLPPGAGRTVRHAGYVVYFKVNLHQVKANRKVTLHSQWQIYISRVPTFPDRQNSMIFPWFFQVF